ncbi:dipeptidase [Pendulispora rubella]|uniref:Dipeptidase n=1 Tax=Pendulispora rubella TaxID=2741070 RepID=A0ABZ2KW30_9BACT
MTSNRLSRRDLVSFAAATLVAGCAGRDANAETPRQAPAVPVKRSVFDSGILFDAAGTIGRDDWAPERGEPLNAKDIEEVLSSGMTAINITVDAGSDPQRPFETTLATIAVIHREIAAHPEALFLVRNAADLRAAKQLKKVGLILSFQVPDELGSKLEHFDTFHNLGVRVMQLTYNPRSLLGDGCAEPANAGLSALGRQAIERMNARGVVIDLSHCGQRTTAEAIEHSKRPVAITHTGCAALTDVPRNKRDDELKRCADKGGVIGIYLMPFFLRRGTQAMASDVIAHIEHAINVCGEDHVGIGTDGTLSAIEVTQAYIDNFHKTMDERKKSGIAAPGEDRDIYPFVPDLNTPRRFQVLGEKLLARKHPESRVRKILGGNFARLFTEVCG